MLVQNLVRLGGLRVDNSNIEEKVGEVVGVNIKPVIDTAKGVVYGLFLHIKVDGNQYDFVWDLYGAAVDGADTIAKYPVTIPITNGDYKRLKRIRKMQKKYKWFAGTMFVRKMFAPLITQIFHMCNVNEWVELIGSKVVVSAVNVTDPDDPRRFSMYIKRINDGPSDYVMKPKWFELHLDNDQEAAEYVDNVNSRLRQISLP